MIKVLTLADVVSLVAIAKLNCFVNTSGRTGWDGGAEATYRKS